MKEFPCRKVVRDGYEVHCLPAIYLETVTDAFLAVAIGLAMFTEAIATLTKTIGKVDGKDCDFAKFSVKITDGIAMLTILSVRLTERFVANLCSLKS